MMLKIINNSDLCDEFFIRLSVSMPASENNGWLHFMYGLDMVTTFQVHMVTF